MTARYGDENSFIAIEDDGSITAGGEGDVAPSQLSVFPQTEPGPEEGTGGYPLWRANEVTLEEGDKPIQFVDQNGGMQYLFVFCADGSVYLFYLGHNFHTGATSYLFLLQVASQPADLAGMWRIYDWIKNLGA